jgi:putative membrane protein
MKKNLLLYLLPLALLGCNNSNQNKDSVEKADSVNEAKNDTSRSADTAATTQATMPVDEATSKFLVKVGDVNMTEVQLGQMAREKASDQRVKDFGNMMVQDHTNASNELKTLAASKNVTLADSISKDHQKKIDDLNKKSGKEFDKAYIDMMEDGHEATIKDFKKNADNKDPDVKAFVNKMLPTLQAHLDSAKAVKKAIK